VGDSSLAHAFEQVVARPFTNWRKSNKVVGSAMNCNLQQPEGGTDSNPRGSQTRRSSDAARRGDTHPLQRGCQAMRVAVSRIGRRQP